MRHGSAADRARLGFESLLAVVMFVALAYYAHGLVITLIAVWLVAAAVAALRNSVTRQR